MNRRRFIAGCATCAALAATQVSLMTAALADTPQITPDLEPRYKPDPHSAEAGLWMSVDAFEEQLKTSALLIPDDDLKAYLTDITCRLGHNYCTDMRVYPMRVPYFNASMSPNGMMQVWSGLLLRVSNEAQLSAVLGHEMGHYLRRHTIKRWESTRDTLNIMAFMTVGLAAAGTTYQITNLAQLAGFGMIFSNSRNAEREADSYGVQMMNKAGYNPFVAATMWERVIAETKVASYKRAQDPFFATHPPSDERVNNIRNQAKELGRREDEPSRETGEFIKIISKRRAMMIEDQLKLRQFNQTELILGWLEKDGFRLGETRYYQGEMYRMRGWQDDLRHARKAYTQALTGDGVPPEAYRALGYVELKDNKPEAAAGNFRRYLDLKPAADDRDMIMSYIGS